jgi:hypothetical protein
MLLGSDHNHSMWLGEECANNGRLIARTSKFCTVTPRFLENYTTQNTPTTHLKNLI